MEVYINNELNIALTFIATVILYSLIWYIVELFMIGKTNENVVDTVIVLIFSALYTLSKLG